MSIEQITQPLPGERVLALAPEDAQRAATDWLRRPNLFAGRALTEPTLEQRQHWQAGRMAQRGQALTAGVVRGLEVATLRRAGEATLLLIEPGQGLAVNGEDVQLVRQLRCQWRDLPVAGAAANITLGNAGGPLPPVGVLVLQPVVVDLANNDPSDPCERCGVEGQGGDASPVSFEDARRVDGARLLWLPWPADWALPRTELRLRNALAHAIFAAEAQLPHGAALPWEEVGVPIALVGLDAAREPLWVDRAAVVRRGGLAREARLQRAANGQLIASSRLGPLWQARIEQFSEHLAELGDPLPPLAEMADPFLHLPPCGLLPAGALDLENRHASTTVSSPFFPPAFELDAVPVPLEQLDLAMREAAPLAPIDISAPERLRLLVPVPQASWEARLLQRETVAPEFQQTLDDFLARRARELGARQAWRHRVALLEGARTGAVPPVPDATADTLALEPESLQPWGPPPAEGGHLSALRAGPHDIRVDGAATGFAVANGDVLTTWVCLDPENPPRALMLQWRDAAGWEHRAVWGEDLITLGRPGTVPPHRVPGHYQMGPLPPAGRWVRLEVNPALVGLAGRSLTGQAFTLFDGRAAFGPTGARLGSVARTWFAQQPPLGAQVTGDAPWQPLGSNDLWAPFDTLAELQPVPVAVPFAGGGHLRAGQPGVHQHYLEGASAVMNDIRSGDELFVWVYLDAQDPPRELMIQFKAGPDWNADGRRAYWGENLIGWGADNTPQRRQADANLPARGQWVRVSVAATALDLVGRTVNGIAFTLCDGAAAFGPCGKLRPATTQGQPPSELPWFGASAPAGATLVGTWRWLVAEQMGEPTPAARVGQVGAVATLAAEPSVRALSAREQAQLGARGLQGFIDFLRLRADRADDLTDFGFTHMQVDLHRVRQLMMSTVDASRLSASPALAAIAKSDSALNVQSQIREYVTRIKATAAPRAAPPAPAPAPRSLTAMLQVNASVAPLTLVKQQTQARYIQPQAAPPKIVYAQPVVGQAELRTAAVADRLRQPPSTEARDYALANRHRAVSALLDLLTAFRNEDGEVPAMLRDFAVPALSDEAFAAGGGPIPRTLEWFADPAQTAAQRAARLAMLLQAPPVMQLRNGVREAVDATESDLFEQTVALSNATIGLLRRLEARLVTYRTAIERAQQALGDLLDTTARALQHRQAADENLAEARHDVSVARALLAEETSRVQAINDRRDRVLREEVPYLAFMRPRETGSVVAVPWRALDPGLVASPVPACLRQHDEVPDELGELLQVLREAPVQQFASGPALLRLIERPQTLVRTLQSAQLRSNVVLQRVAAPVASIAAASASKMTQHITGLLHKQQQQTLVARSHALQRVDIASLAALNWQQTQAAAQAVISLGDLIDGDHGSGEVARRAAALFDGIAAVCTCLHAEFSAVSPSIRLDWAELMSQFDETPNLRNLASLPRWAQIGGIDRRQMQAFVDHLFSQVDARQASALALANDLVRMALLLASHAPVGRIVAGRLPRPVTGVRVGTRIALAALDATRLKVGMQALLYQGTEIVARARVEDVGSLEASATVVHARGGQVDLGLDVRVQFEVANVVAAPRARALGVLG